MNLTSFMIGVIFGAFIMMVLATVYVLQDMFKDNQFEKGYRCGYEHGSMLKEILEKKKQDETNMVEAVRCKDCKNADYGTDEDGDRFMKCIGSVKCYGGTTPDFFCADGVAKDINVPSKESR